MLRKLLKHDFKATGKVLLPLNLLLVLFTVIGSLLLSTNFLQRPELLPLAIILLVAYVFFIIALGMITIIYLTVYFYRNLFSAQGYLTFTLPATPWTLLNSKLIMGFSWLMLGGVLSYASVMALIVSASGSSLSNMDFLSFHTTYNVNGVTMNYAGNLLDLIGYSTGELIVIFILFSFSSALFSILMSYACVSLGQLYSKHKVGSAIGIYVGVYFLIQVLTTVVVSIICIRPVMEMIMVAEDDLSPAVFESFTQALYKPMIPAFIIIFFLFSIGFYLLTGLIMNKKVNLD